MLASLPSVIAISVAEFLNPKEFTLLSTASRSLNTLYNTDNSINRFIGAKNTVEGLPFDSDIRATFFNKIFTNEKRPAAEIKQQWRYQASLIKTLRGYDEESFAKYLRNSPDLTEQAMLAITTSVALIERMSVSVLQVPEAREMNIVDLDSYRNSLPRFLQLAIANEIIALRMLANQAFFQKAVSIENSPLFVLGYHHRYAAEYLLVHLDKLPIAIKQADNFTYVACTHREICAMVLSSNRFKDHFTPLQLEGIAEHKKLQDELDACSQRSSAKKLRLV